LASFFVVFMAVVRTTRRLHFNAILPTSSRIRNCSNYPETISA
jgi:hypothetical protein